MTREIIYYLVGYSYRDFLSDDALRFVESISNDGYAFTKNIYDALRIYDYDMAYYIKDAMEQEGFEQGITGFVISMRLLWTVLDDSGEDAESKGEDDA